MALKTGRLSVMRSLLAEHERLGLLWRGLDDGEVQCTACTHRCRIVAGAAGACGVRVNRSGRLFAPSGYVSAMQVEPIEKKPFFHVMPGGRTLSFGMFGCNMRCAYCQNWVVSQTVRDEAAISSPYEITPDEIVARARRADAQLLVATYNEPLVTAEWLAEVFAAARRSGLTTAVVSNGCATDEVLDHLRPWVDSFRVDLKCFDNDKYHWLGSSLRDVLDGIRRIHAMGVWLEIVTPLIPGFNDAANDIESSARFLASISSRIPWHLTSFHGDYRMRNPRATEPQDAASAATIARSAGLEYVYAGGFGGRAGDLENTWCPSCGELLVRRTGYTTLECLIDSDGCCSRCRMKVPGLWGLPGHHDAAEEKVQTPVRSRWDVG